MSVISDVVKISHDAKKYLETLDSLRIKARVCQSLRHLSITIMGAASNTLIYLCSHHLSSRELDSIYVTKLIGSAALQITSS